MDSSFDSIIEGCARLYRIGHEAEAATLMQQLIEQFTQAMQEQPTILTQEVQNSVAMTLSYQETQDWIGLADELQYVLYPAIQKTFNK